MRLKVTLYVAGCVALMASASIATGATRPRVVGATFAEYSVVPPTPASVFVCHGFGCKYRVEIDLTTGDRAKLAQFLAPGRASAAAERKAVAAAGAWFDKRGLLRYHDGDEPEARGYMVDGRPPHATAVLVERATGKKWSIDSWTVGYGQALEVMPLERWKDLD